MLKVTATTSTTSGITFTVNDDKSITVNGTSTGRIIFVVGKVYIAQTGNYTYTGTPAGGSSSKYSMNYRNNNVYKDVDIGSGNTAHFDGGKTYEAVIDIRSGVTMSSLTFYPMLRDADITDSTYETHIPSVVDRCFLKDNANITLYEGALGSSNGSITIENLSNYSLLWVYIDGIGATAGNFATSVEIPVAYLAKGNSLKLAGGIPSSMEVTESGVGAAGYITARITSTNVLKLSISSGTIGNVKIVSIM